MATSFITTLPAACFSCALPDVRVTTDADFVVCTVRDGENALVIQLKSYAYLGTATFCDLRSIVGQWLLDKGVVARTFSFAVRESMAEQADVVCQADVFVAYCDYTQVRSSFNATAARQFLTSLKSKVIYPGITEYLHFLALPGEAVSLAIDGTAQGTNGTTKSFSLTWTADDVDEYIAENYAVSLASLKSQAGGTPLAFTCRAGSRLFTFYAAREMPPCVFLFRNAYNAIETAAFFGTTTAKQEVEREEAVSGGTTSFYDQHTQRSFEVESAALAPDTAEWLAQLLASPDVRLWQDGASWDNLPRILITESTYEVSDSDTEQRRVKFTWQYAEDFPTTASSSSVTSGDGIFTAQFNQVFS